MRKEEGVAEMFPSLAAFQDRDQVYQHLCAVLGCRAGFRQKPLSLLGWAAAAQMEGTK